MAPTEIYVLRLQGVEILVIALGIVVVDELADAVFKVTGQIVVFLQHLAFH